MSCVNKVILIGNLGRDPELRFTAKGRAVANLSVATSENWKDENGEWQQLTQWHRVIIWGERAQTLSTRLNKGIRIYVEGPLKHRSWEDDGGQRRFFSEVHARRAFPLDAPADGAAKTDEQPSGTGEGKAGEDVPF